MLECIYGVSGRCRMLIFLNDSQSCLRVRVCFNRFSACFGEDGVGAYEAQLILSPLDPKPKNPTLYTLNPKTLNSKSCTQKH